MKEMDLQDLREEEKKFWGNFNNILKNSDYNLDKYTNGHNFEFGNIMNENCDRTVIEVFFDIFPFLVNEFGTEYFTKKIKKLDDWEKNIKFSKWLTEYAKNIQEEHRRVEKLLNCSNDSCFEKQLTECFQAMVLEQKSVKEIVEEKGLHDEEKVKVLYRIIDGYICNYIYNNFSKKRVYMKIYSFFGISEEQCEIIYDLLKSNELLIRSIYGTRIQIQMDKKIKRINELFEDFIEMISDYDE